MAKSPITHKVTTTNKLTFKGVASADGTTIEIDGNEKDIADFFKKFAGKEIEGTVTEKSEEEIEEK